MAGDTLTAQPLDANLAFNWIFLVELLVCGILSLFFLYYFNRLFGTLISYALRAYTWHRYRVWVDVQALQFSLLGGRIFFRGFRYHGNNETILIHSGYITWRYWLSAVRLAECLTPDPRKSTGPEASSGRAAPESPRQGISVAEKGGCEGPSQLPCRLVATVQGLEWFVYNRSVAYDALVASMSTDAASTNPTQGLRSGTASLRRRGHRKEMRAESEKAGTTSDSTAHPLGSLRHLGLKRHDTASSKSHKPRPAESETVEATSSTVGATSRTTSPTSLPDRADNNHADLSDASLLTFFPIQIECTKGAVVLGNDRTRCILTTKFDKALGEVDATHARAPDKYRQVFQFHFVHPVMQMKANPDFKEPTPVNATHPPPEPCTTRTNPRASMPTPARIGWRRQLWKRWHALRYWLPFSNASVHSLLPNADGEKPRPGPVNAGEPSTARWIGLSRYLVDDPEEEHQRWGSVEYAKFPTVLDSPAVDLSLYWDVPGIVPKSTGTVSASSQDGASDINGDVAPAWGIDLRIDGGTLNYGPWADRQRVELQAVFFPRLCIDATPAEKLAVGTLRVSTAFKLFVDLTAETSVRVPIREKSKDWKWKGRADGDEHLWRRGDGAKARTKPGRDKKSGPAEVGADLRPFGWLDHRVKANSTISYVGDMVARDVGYKATLDLDLRDPEISSSVNHGLLLRSGDLSISCDLSNPLQWNRLRTWTFDIVTERPELFLLRDHVAFLSDLIDDWGSGPPADFYSFTPFKYLIKLRLGQFNFHLNANDHNIINDPASFEDNTFVTVHGDELVVDVAIPLDQYRPTRNEITVDVEGHRGGLRLHSPLWNTQATFLDDPQIANLEDLTLHARYATHPVTTATATDTLLLGVGGSSVSVKLYGFLVRYFFKLRDNYFGEDIHFKTLEEYQQLRTRRLSEVEAAAAERHPDHHRKGNDLDVVVTIEATDGVIMLPANLYSAQNHVRIDLAHLGLELRFTNYYMDLQVDFSPLSASLGTLTDDHGTPAESVTGVQSFVDGVTIYAHRLFGLPPAEPTYVCNWDVDVGAITGECSTDFLLTLLAAVRNLAFTFEDRENAFPQNAVVELHDITFLRARLQPVRLWFHTGDAASLIETKAITLDYDDWAGCDFSARLDLRIPDIIWACVNAESALRHRAAKAPPAETHAYVQTSFTLTMLHQKAHAGRDRSLQQQHLRNHDQRTRRAECLRRRPELLSHTGDAQASPIDRDAPNMPCPPLPDPVRPDPAAGSVQLPMLALPAFDQAASSGPRSASSQESLRSVRRLTDASRLQACPDRVSLPSDGRRSTSVVTPSLSRRSARSEPWATPTGVPTSPLAVHSPSLTVPGVPPSRVAFASSFLPPYFSLETIEPDLKDVPTLPHWSDPLRDEDHELQVPTASMPEDDEASHTGIIIKMDTGVRAFVNLVTLHTAVNFLGDLQIKRPIDLLDALQVGVMSRIINDMKAKGSTKTVMDLKVDVPCVQARVINFYDAPSGPGSTSGEDVYNASLSRLSITTRTKLHPPEEGRLWHAEDLQALQVSLGSLDFSVMERLEGSHSVDAAVHGGITDVALSLIASKAVMGRVRLDHAEIAMESEKIGYLASLIDRTTAQAQLLREEILVPAIERTKRLRDLTAALALEVTGVPDPSFLSRPSYVLRSASHHLRSSDSWKVVSRLRHMYQSLDSAHKARFDARCLQNAGQSSADAQRRVLEMFEQWRGWELSDVRQSKALREIFGISDKAEAAHGERRRPIEGHAVATRLGLLIDPGPKQSEIALLGLGADYALSLPSVGVAGIPRAQLSVLTSRVAIRLNWELCELAERLVALQRARFLKHSADLGPPRPVAQEPPTARGWDFHVVLRSDVSTVVLDGINVKSISLSKGLIASVVVAGNPRHPMRTVTTLAMHSDVASTEVMSHARVLTITKVRSPSIYASHSEGSVAEAAVAKFSATARELSLEVVDEMLGMLEVIDLVIGDEVAYLQRVMSSAVPAATAALQEPAEAPARPKIPTKIYMALFLDVYNLTVALLPSFKYVISGRVARTSLAPNDMGDLVFDFDLKQHSHQVQALTKAVPHTVSLLDMPPINGRVICRSLPEHLALEVFVTIESIMLDAGVIQHVFETMTRPEIANTLDEISLGIRAVQTHLGAVRAPPDALPPTATVVANRLVYRVHLTAAGLGVHASAPGSPAEARAAHLEFCFGSVQLRATNQQEGGEAGLEFPEMQVGLRQISLELLRSGAEESRPCGRVIFGAYFSCSSRPNAAGTLVRAYHAKSDALEITVVPETAATLVDVVGHLHERISELDLSKEVSYLQRLRKPKALARPEAAAAEAASTDLFGAIYSLDLNQIQISWIVGPPTAVTAVRESEDLVLAIKRIHLATSKENAARLVIEDCLLQLVPLSRPRTERSVNSALLPEMVFNVAYLTTPQERRLAFQAAGKSLDLRLTSQFLLGASDVQRSIATATGTLRAATASWHAVASNAPSTTLPPSINESRGFFGAKRLSSLLVYVDFAGAVVYLQGRPVADMTETGRGGVTRAGRVPQHGRYGQFSQDDASGSTTLRAPGVAFKVEYRDPGQDDPTLNAEIKVDASSNTLYPTVVPLVMEMMGSVKEIVRTSESAVAAAAAGATTSTSTVTPKVTPSKFLDDERLLISDPSTILGRCRLSVGVRICRQEFSLSCQPIARVAATARFQDIYITINTVKTTEHGHFFAVAVSFTHLQASVQHVYSRESTGEFDVESIVLSLMNSKHVSGTNGISTILKVGPVKAQINARQLQDFLLFREIWVPPEIRLTTPATPSPTLESQTYLMQRYQQVAAAAAFPWNAAIAVSELELQLDLGQSLGKSSFVLANLWVSAKKASDWEQNLCLGFDRVGVDSAGRMSGFVDLQQLRVRTSIQWRSETEAMTGTPLIQASIAVGQLRLKVAFDYQAFLVADVTSFAFLMYNVREVAADVERGDRLVGTLDGDRVQVFCTTTSAAQGTALYQALVRLVQEKRAAYESSLKEIEKFLRRSSNVPADAASLATTRHGDVPGGDTTAATAATPASLSLHTDVVVSLRAINVGAFPSTFADNQIFKLEALDARARFAVSTVHGQIHSRLGLTLGQLRVALSAVRRTAGTHALGDVDVGEVVSSATGSRGGTILKVPRVVATMQTWQQPGSTQIDYVFTSSLEGKVDVGWNYSRISFIRGMWGAHTRALAERLGKPLAPSAVRITGVPGPAPETGTAGAMEAVVSPDETPAGEPPKITAVVTVPQSRYQYTALEPPIIETPQLRDMGEATPPLEWIGLHRDRLPNLTHQIVIVTLLEVAREVEDAYARILGSS